MNCNDKPKLLDVVLEWETPEETEARYAAKPNTCDFWFEPKGRPRSKCFLAIGHRGAHTARILDGDA